MNEDPRPAISEQATVLLEISPRPQIIADPRGTILRSNAAAQDMTAAVGALPASTVRELLDALAKAGGPKGSEGWSCRRNELLTLLRDPDRAGTQFRVGCHRLRIASFGPDLRLLDFEPIDQSTAAEGRIEDDREMMAEMLEHMDQGIILYDRNAAGEEVVRFFNSKAPKLLELPPGFLRPGMPRRNVIRYCDERGDHPDDFDAARYIDHATHGQAVQILSKRPSGRWVLNVSYPRQCVEGSMTLYVDISQSICAQQRLSESQAQYQALAETAPTGIVKVDARGTVVFANRAAKELFGCSLEEFDLAKQVLPSDGSPMLEQLAWNGRFEADIRMPHGIRHAIVSISDAIGETDPQARIVTFADVTLLRQARSQIEHMARHDPLTGLGNRALFAMKWEALEQSLSHEPRPVHLLALDLDHFKSVNDDHGHGVGDRLLRHVAARLKEACPVGGTSFRLGGDEFAMILEGSDRAEAVEIATGLVETLSRPFQLDGALVSIGCSAGIASLPLDGTTAEKIQHAADVALYQVKRNGRNGVACFDPAQEREMLERRRLESDLALAVAHGDFTLAFQPQIDLRSGAITGVETLLRWFNKRLDCFVSPSVFIPIAENCGLIGLIDTWVVRKAVRQVRAFLDDGAGPLSTSINLSPVSLAGPSVVEVLLTALSDHDVDPALITVEVTEGVAIAEFARVTETLATIRAAGVRVAIDDFGAGHTSLSYIQALPIDRIKIDRSLIERIASDESTRAIVASVRDLCERLGLQLTAEGIETFEQWEELKDLGLVDGQGFYLAHPESAELFLNRRYREAGIMIEEPRCLGAA